MSKTASEMIISEILKKPDLVLGFATGKTPKKLYKNLIRAHKKKKIDFSKIRAFNLDEYYPLDKKNKKSYRNYMFRNLFEKVNIKKENINLLDGSNKDWKKECNEYEKKISKYRIDLQILGIGVNGHIGFNEPGSGFYSKTRLVNLAPETVKRNKFLDKGLTIGISTIMKSKKIILLASGKIKAKAVKGLIGGKINSNLPASFLRKHKNLVVIIDKKAGEFI